MITRENYEEYMMMHADGELSASQEQELMSFLYEHPEFQHELTAFKMTKLIPDDSLVYTRKVSLLKPEGGAKLVPLMTWKRYAVAAGVAALLMVSGYNILNQMSTEVPTVANATVPVKVLPNTEANQATTTTESTPTATAIAGTATANKADETPMPAPRNIETNKGIAGLDHRKKENTPSVINEPLVAHNAPLAQANEMQISKVNPAEMVVYNSGKEISSATVTNLPPAAIYVYEGQNETKQSIVNKLPIDELKKEGMENVVAAMANGYDKINAIKQGISETVVSFKVEKRKLIVSF